VYEPHSISNTRARSEEEKLTHGHSIVTGGHNLYGIPIGMMMLDGRFPRIPGDAGNATTWPFPVLFRVVRGASPDSVVRHLAPDAWLQPFIEAAQELEAAGVGAVTTNCGFLVLFQPELQHAVTIPMLTSSLLQVPWIASLLPPGRSVGVLTIEARSLTPDHLRAAGIRDDMPVVISGLEDFGGYFTQHVLGNQVELDVARCEAEHVDAARAMVEHHPDLGAIVLECTNMPPYAHAIRQVTGLPVFDITTLVRWAVTGIQRQPFVGSM
jgi:Asp/Glu/hydantoin racemase